MRASHLSLIVAAFSAAALGTYAFYAMDRQAERAPATDTAEASAGTQDSGEEVAALRRELSRLRAELRSDGRSEPEPGASAEDRVAEELARLASTLERLESEVGSLRAQVGTMSADHGHGPPLAAGESVGLPNSEEMRRLAQEESTARAQELESGFELEGEDPEWSRQTTNEILQALAHKEIAGAQVYDAQCRSTLCRVEVEYTDPAQRTSFQINFPYLVRRSLPRMSIHTKDLEDGRQSMVIYLARQGHELPAGQGPLN